VIERTDFGDVTRLRMWTVRSRLAGYDVSAYLVRGVLVDTGPWHVRNDLKRFMAETRLRGAIVTHWHEDHAGNVATIASGGMPMWIAPATLETLRRPIDMKLYRRFTWGVPPTIGGDVAPFDPAPLRVIESPGHSSDHHIVFDDNTATLFSADLWLGVRVRIFGLHENPYHLMESLRRAAELKPRRMFDAHRGEVANPVKALEAKRSWLSESVDAIQRRLDAGDPEDVILRDLLGGEERTGFVSGGEYSRLNLIRAVTRDRP